MKISVVISSWKIPGFLKGTWLTSTKKEAVVRAVMYDTFISRKRLAGETHTALIESVLVIHNPRGSFKNTMQ